MKTSPHFTAEFAYENRTDKAKAYICTQRFEMNPETRYRTIDLARLAKCSVQKVRNWEALGFLPPVKRGSNGYRYYTDQHVEAFHVSRALGFPWVIVLDIMQAVHRADLPAALAIIDAHQAHLHRQREHTRDTLVALRDASSTLSKRRTISISDGPITIGTAARQAGVRVSAVRFWEQQGLLQPVREKYSRYRRYDVAQLRQLQIIATLRKADYSFDAIRTVLDELASGNTEQAIAAAEQRLTELTRVSAQRLRGLALLWRYVEKYFGEQLTHLQIPADQ